MPGYIDTIGDISDVPWANQPGMVVINVTTTPIQLLAGDSNRTVLIFSADGTNLITLGNSANLSINQGIILTAGNNHLVLTQQEHGILVTLPWFALSANAGGFKVGVLSASVTRFGARTSPSIIQEIDNGSFAANYVRRANGTRRPQQYADRWRKRPANSPYDLPYL